MKHFYNFGKATLAACVLMFGASTAFAQVNNIEATNSFPGATSVVTPATGLNNSEVLWQQERAETGGIVTGFFDGLDTAVFSADDFELNETAQITSISTVGFQNNQTLLDGVLLGYEIYIYTNSAGAPSGNPYEEDSWLYVFSADTDDSRLSVTQEANIFTFTADLSGEGLFLEAGRYWLIAAPIHDMIDLDGSNRWNWAQGEQNFGEPLLIDPDNNFGAGATNWTAFSALGVDWNPSGLTFTIEGIAGASAELGDFGLLSPPDGFVLDTPENDETPVEISWEASANAQTYTWVANLPGAGFDEPLLSLASDSDGTATTLTLTTGIIYDVVTGLGVEPGSSVTVEWTVFAAAGDNSLQAEDVFSVTFNLIPSTSTGTGETVEGFELSQNYPNPFNPTTNISFTLPETSNVTLEVFNMQGQRVATLVNNTMSQGSHVVTFDAASLSSGIYLYRLNAGNFTATNKMMLVK
ncbi:MAG: T9SS type A sorting domain-containing protein [Balneolales bacterium]|nr:T9SS type A sorting domain-containing protein [Balneolales bacterium]